VGIFEMILGNPGISILIWLQEHVEYVSAVLGVYLLIILPARFQQKKIEARTKKLINEKIKDLKTNRSKVTLSILKKNITPIWIQESKTWGKYILGKRGLFPIRFKPEESYDRFITQEVLEESLNET